MYCTETHESCHKATGRDEWLTAWVCKDLCMLLNYELQWEWCQWLSWLLFEVAHYVILDPNQYKRWARSWLTVLNCFWDQRRCEEESWTFLFCLLKTGGQAGWAGIKVLRYTITPFPVNFNLAIWITLCLFERRMLSLLLVTFHLVLVFWEALGSFVIVFFFSGGCLVQLLSAQLQGRH